MINTPQSNIENLLRDQTKVLNYILRELVSQNSPRASQSANPASEISLGESKPTTLGSNIKTFVIIQALPGKGTEIKYTPLEEFYGTLEDAKERALKIQKVGLAALAPAKVVTVQEYFDLKNMGRSVEPGLPDLQKQKQSQTTSRDRQDAEVLAALNALFAGLIPPTSKKSNN